MEKALLYFDCHELPQNWAKEELLGTDDDSENDDEEVNINVLKYFDLGF